MVAQRNRKWIFGLSSAAFLAFLGMAIPTWIETKSHIGALILFASSALCSLVSICFGWLLWRHRKDEVIEQLKTKNEAAYDGPSAGIARGGSPVIGIDADESLVNAPGAKIKNQDIGIKSRKSIINIPGSEIRDERKGKEDR